jgi:phosphoglycerate dehydrogenase-like enzyme
MNILFCGKTFPRAPEVLAGLLPEDYVVSCPVPDVKEAGLRADVIIPLMHRLESELIRGTSAKLIHQWGVGLEGVDIPAATKRGILVCNVPGDMTANADSTAEHALFLMLGLARRIHECFKAFDGGLWGAPVGEALTGNTALVVGFGRVGKALAGKLNALGMNVEAIRRTPDPAAEKAAGVTRVGALSDMHEMATGADFVISTVVLTEETRGIFDKKLFRSMKRSAYVINVSRGPVVNESDLLDALQTRIIGGAGLDVYAQEPVDPANPLLSMDNVLATPHIAGCTRQNYEGIGRILADNILMFKRGEIPNHCVNPEVTEGK